MNIRPDYAEEEELAVFPPLTRPLKRLERYKPHQRYYTKDGIERPGSSTIAKIGLDTSNLMYWAWDCGRKGLDYRKVRDTAADIGTIAHFMIECYFEDCEPDLSEFSEEDIEAARVPYESAVSWWESHDLVAIAPEMQLVSEKYGYGGTIDVPCRGKTGSLELWDWKTSKGIYPDHLYQLSAYENLLHENLNEQVVRRGIVRIGKDGSFEVKPMGDMSAHFQVFKAQLALYNSLQALK